MKIGIITLPLHNNYGGILQAFALQKVLQNMGHDVTVIDKERRVRPSLKDNFIITCKRLVKKILVDKSITAFNWAEEVNRNILIMRKNTYPFIQKYIKRIELKEKYSEIKENDYDAFVVGSDQIWRPMQLGNKVILDAFLLFARNWNVKRIAYAASFGTEEWEFNSYQAKVCKELIQLFDAVSVREESGVELCNKHFSIEALHVLDPTMLLNVEEYINLFKTADTPQSKGSLMCYILDRDNKKDELVSYIEETLSLKAFSVNSKYEQQYAPIEERIQPPVEEWIRGFYDAECVITDSFHACVFSILFKKRFFVYGNKKRGMARFLSLLKIFGLENRLVFSREDAEKIVNEPIDWDKVDKIKEEWKQKSFNFISKNL